MKIFYPSTGPRFGSQHLHRSSQLSIPSAPGDLTFLSSIHGPQACLRCTYIWVGNTPIHDKRKVNSSKHFFFKIRCCLFTVQVRWAQIISPAWEFISLELTSLMESQLSSAVSLRDSADTPWRLLSHLTPWALGLVIQLSIWLWLKAEKAELLQLENSKQCIITQIITHVQKWLIRTEKLTGCWF